MIRGMALYDECRLNETNNDWFAERFTVHISNRSPTPN